MEHKFAAEFVRHLQQKVGEKYNCPICHGKKGVLVMPGIFIHVLHEDDIDIMRFGPNGVLTVPLVCQNCGFLSQHVASYLVDDYEKFQKEYSEQSKKDEIKDKN